MKKNNDKLSEEFRRKCEEAVRSLSSRWGIDPSGHWVNGDPNRGGLYRYDAGLYVGLPDLFYCLREGVTYREYSEWEKYLFRTQDLMEKGHDVRPIGLRAWHEGAPRLTQEELAILENT